MEAVFSIRNLRTCHVVATSDPLVDNLIVFQKLFTVIATASHGKL
jgi:hypothetical protein